jgi:hypothetical protein
MIGTKRVTISSHEETKDKAGALMPWGPPRKRGTPNGSSDDEI